MPRSKSNFEYKKTKGGKPTATSITMQQRSTCAAVFYQWSQTDITKIFESHVINSFTNQDSTKDNLKVPTYPTIVRDDIIKCTINKFKGPSSGTFSMTLKKGKRVIRGKNQPQDVDYLKVLHPGDWVMIYMKKSGGAIPREDLYSTEASKGLKFLGIVENVRYVEVDDPTSATPRLEYIVTGRDFGKVFDTNVFYNPIATTADIGRLLGGGYMFESSIALKGNFSGGVDAFTPDKVVKDFATFYLLGQENFQVNSINQAWYIPSILAEKFGIKVKNKPNGVSFVDILNLNRIGLHEFKNNKFIKASPLKGSAAFKSIPANGTVWAILEHFKNSVVNEMYTELVKNDDGKLEPALVMRQFPYSNKKGATNPFTVSSWGGSAAGRKDPRQRSKASNGTDQTPDNEKTFFVDLPRTTIVSSDIKQKNIGKSDFERINHIIITPKSDFSTFDIVYYTALNVPSIQRHGLHTLSGQSIYVLNSSLRVDAACAYFSDLLVDWFFLSHQYFNGTIIIDGVDEHVELGTNLYIEDIKQLFHIEGYVHSYIQSPTGEIDYTTQLTVSRGQELKSDKVAQFISSSDESTTISSSILSRDNKK